MSEGGRPGRGKPSGPQPRRAGERPHARTGDRSRPPQRAEARAPELVVFGRRAVLEALRSERTINRVYIDQGIPPAAFAPLFEAANGRGLHIEGAPRARLEALAGPHHQGAVALCAPIAYVDIEAILARARGQGEPALIVALDGVQDPQNIGSLIRSAEVAGAHGVVLPERRAGAVTPAVVRAAAGAALHLPVARVKNLAQAVVALQEAGLQVVVAHPDAADLVYQVDLQLPTAIVVGGEGKGVSDLVRRRADAVVRLPQRGSVASLNAAVAGAVMLYEAVRQRTLGGAPK